jgi:Mn2+/Fe2+ NRAMP family transporter
MINGVVAVPVMATMMLLSNHPAAVGHFRLPRVLEILGWVATFVMLAAAIGMFATWNG